ncbi:MAG TPA: tyrosine-type recombinase/integrase [Candidatus Acidoferrales bacterium]|jgi:integrase|nr:tyrosine-type recombinase/integrase [Candidatus Acidoferrales bacterium]
MSTGIDLSGFAFTPKESELREPMVHYYDALIRLDEAAFDAGVKVEAQGQRTNEHKGDSLARKRYQIGSLMLRNKSWIARWREDIIGTDDVVRRVRVARVVGTLLELPTKKLAHRRLEVMLARINSAGYRPQRVATLADFVERWKVEVLSQRKPSTKAAAEGHLRKYIIPELGRLRLEEITVERQQQFIARLSPQMSRKTLLNVLGTLGSMLGTAAAWGYVAEAINRKKLTLPHHRERSQRRFFTVEEIRRIVAEASEPLSTICFLAASTGMREGELFGLKVDDIDFKSNVIHVRRSVWRGKIQATKSRSSERVLHMPASLAARLKLCLETWHPNALGLLFASRQGTPIRPSHIVPRKLHPLLDRLEIERAGFHAFRHSHSTLLVELGAPVTVAQAQLGHSDLATTMRTYTHLMPQTQRDAVDRLGSVLDPNGLKPQPKLLN